MNIFIPQLPIINCIFHNVLGHIHQWPSDIELGAIGNLTDSLSYCYGSGIPTRQNFLQNIASLTHVDIHS